jgi:hypothetical protein
MRKKPQRKTLNRDNEETFTKKKSNKTIVWKIIAKRKPLVCQKNRADEGGKRNQNQKRKRKPIQLQKRNSRENKNEEIKKTQKPFKKASKETETRDTQNPRDVNNPDLF